MDGDKKTIGQNLIKSEKEMLKDDNFWQYLFQKAEDENSITVEDMIEAWEHADYINFGADTMVAERPFSSDFEKICDAVAKGFVEYKKENINYDLYPYSKEKKLVKV